jgi:transcriptional regulator with XRE-family HTH domain
MAGKKQRTLGDRIRLLRKQKGLTQDKVAEIAGIDSKSLSRIECDIFNPSIETLERLASALNVRMQDFFTEELESPKALRAYLFEVVCNATDKELAQLVQLISRLPRGRHK